MTVHPNEGNRADFSPINISLQKSNMNTITDVKNDIYGATLGSGYQYTEKIDRGFNKASAKTPIPTRSINQNSLKSKRKIREDINLKSSSKEAVDKTVNIKNFLNQRIPQNKSKYKQSKKTEVIYSRDISDS